MTAELNPSQRSLGRYQLFELLGEGGMAEVFLALDTGTLGLDRWVAIKRVHRELTLEKRFVDMFFDEIRLAARIAHPNVAQVLDVGESEGVPYLVMEYLRGRPLSEVIHRSLELDQKTELDLMCRVVADACEGAHAAHGLRGIDGRALGLVHRDLSPHNIFVTFDGAVKVMDFGIAKAIGRSTRTAPGTRKGKFSYMPPEQVRGEDVDRRADVYALGVVLYEATSGAQLFEGFSDLERRGAGIAEIVPPSKHRRGYPKALEQIVMRAIAHRPEDRFETAREMSEALERFLVDRRALTNPGRIADLMTRSFPSGQRPLPVEGQGTPSVTPLPVAVARAPVKLELASVPLARDRETRVAPPAKPRPPLRAHAMVIAAVLGVIGGGGLAGALIFGRPPPPVERPPVIGPAPAQEPSPSPSPEVATDPDPDPDPDPAPLVREDVVRRERAPRAVASKPGSLDIRCEPWATVFVDGREVQATPLVGLPLSAGSHRLELVTEDGRSKRMKVKINSGRPTTLDVRF